MRNIGEIKDFTDVIEFEAGGDFFVKDNKARAVLNKTLETNYKAVYRRDFYKNRTNWKENDINWCGEEFFVLTVKNRLIRFSNSEWAWMKEVKF